MNELYNALIEDPSKLQAAAEVPVDILFSSFEKFVKRAWQDRMGPLAPRPFLDRLQSGCDSARPEEFAQKFKRLSEETSPQNRRAFGAAIKLLSNLLEASGNDGDRGALMASFTEVLVPDGNPHDYISLFDRLLEDHDALFESNTDKTEECHAASSATNSLGRTRSTNTGSLNSNASSLRRKFGLASLSRENSKSESESKLASVWRTLSKNVKSLEEGSLHPGGQSKNLLIRSKSIDTDTRMPSPGRPSSRDLPTPPGPPIGNQSHSRPTSSHLNFSGLGTIGEATPMQPTPMIKKKRRSSLSDLKLAQEPVEHSPWLPLQPRKQTSSTQGGGISNTLPRTPAVSKPAEEYTQRFSSPDRFGSLRKGLPQRYGSPKLKENSPNQELSRRREYSPTVSRLSPERQTMAQASKEAEVNHSNSSKQKTPQTSIPAPRQGLSERLWPPNGTKAVSRSLVPAGQKLRIQSPQKLRERLSNEQRALSIADSNVQAEIAKIGEEMSAFKISRPNVQLPGETHENNDFETLVSSIAALQTRLANFVSDLTARNESVKKDLESSLAASEKKARKLDGLYQEANAENEALYERFNDELGKILKSVRSGGGTEESRGKMKEAQEEVVKLKRENQRLKREVVGLRSQLLGG